MVDILEKKVTVPEFMLLDDFEEGFQYELINGEIEKKQAPSPEHQNVSVNLVRIFSTFARERKLGKIFHAPLDVYFTEIDSYQPDLIFCQTSGCTCGRKMGSWVHRIWLSKSFRLGLNAMTATEK